MATKRGTKRKDKSRVVLKKGESQRKDGTYDYRWTSKNGKRHSTMLNLKSCLNNLIIYR